MSTDIEPLNAVEADELADCEQRIAAGIESFRAVGLALKRVRDARLYRDTHATFEDYCREKWNFTRTHGNNLILAAVTIDALPDDLATIVAKSQGAARELAKVEPDRREEVIRKAAEAGPVTAKAIKQAAAAPADVEAHVDLEPAPRPVIAALSLPEDQRSREFRVSRKMQEIKTEVKDFLTALNPQRRDLIQAALSLKHLAAELERAAVELPED